MDYAQYLIDIHPQCEYIHRDESQSIAHGIYEFVEEQFGETGADELNKFYADFYFNYLKQAIKDLKIGTHRLSKTINKEETQKLIQDLYQIMIENYPEKC